MPIGFVTGTKVRVSGLLGALCTGCHPMARSVLDGVRALEAVVIHTPSYTVLPPTV